MGVQQRIAEDGEMQVKSPGLMMGYFKNEEATKETMTEDGWLRTGDKGEIDDMGRFKITGRTKEIFKTSKGKYVAPAPIENIINNSPSVELSCVTGSGRPAPVGLVSLAEDLRPKQDDPAVRAKVEQELTALLGHGLDAAAAEAAAVGRRAAEARRDARAEHVDHDVALRERKRRAAQARLVRARVRVRRVEHGGPLPRVEAEVGRDVEADRARERRVAPPRVRLAAGWRRRAREPHEPE